MRVKLAEEQVSVKEGKISIIRNDEEFITKEQLKKQIDNFDLEMSRCVQEHIRIKEVHDNYKKAKEKALEMIAMIEAEETPKETNIPDSL